nr:hypothetical protein [Tanacetum cinerariifolium]
MVNLEFCDMHNMVAYLKKTERNEGFDQIVDFLNANHIRHLQLADSDGISSLPTTKIFEQLSLMSNTKRASKSYTGENIPLFPTMIVQGLVVQGEGLTHPPILPTQSPVADEAASTDVDVRYGGATTTVTCLEVGQGSENAEIQRRYGHNTKINTASTAITTANININTAEPVTTVSTPITTVGVSVSTAEPSTLPTTTTTVIEDEDLTIAQTLMKMIRVIIRKANETTTRPTIPPQKKLDPKDKGTGKMVEPEKPLKKKDQIEFDEEVARNLEAQLQAKLEEEERLARQKEEEANIALIVEWNDVQAMMDADHELVKGLQAEEQGKLTIEERSKLFVELMNQRKKHFARLRVEENRRKPPTKPQKRKQMCTYLKNMVGFTLKDRAEGSETREEGSSKRARDELKSDKSKKQKLDEKVEAKVDNDQEEAEMKMYIKIVFDDEVAINATPLATKPPIIVD